MPAAEPRGSSGRTRRRRTAARPTSSIDPTAPSETGGGGASSGSSYHPRRPTTTTRSRQGGGPRPTSSIDPTAPIATGGGGASGSSFRGTRRSRSSTGIGSSIDPGVDPSAGTYVRTSYSGAPRYYYNPPAPSYLGGPIRQAGLFPPAPFEELAEAIDRANESPLGPEVFDFERGVFIAGGSAVGALIRRLFGTNAATINDPELPEGESGAAGVRQGYRRPQRDRTLTRQEARQRALEVLQGITEPINWTGTDAQRARNAQIIVEEGRRRGLPERDIQAALQASLIESGLINVNFGDRDSLGIFQQRGVSGWGPAEERLDPRTAANKFYDSLEGMGPTAPSADMSEVARRQRTPAENAQLVQRSDTGPASYQEQESNAQRILRALSGVSSTRRGSQPSPRPTGDPNRGRSMTGEPGFNPNTAPPGVRDWQPGDSTVNRDIEQPTVRRGRGTAPTREELLSPDQASRQGYRRPGRGAGSSPSPTPPPGRGQPSSSPRDTGGRSGSTRGQPEPRDGGKPDELPQMAEPQGGTGGGGGGGGAPLPEAAREAVESSADTAAEAAQGVGGSVLDAFRAGTEEEAPFDEGENVTDLRIDEGGAMTETTVTSQRSWFVYALVAAAIVAVGVWYFRSRGGGGGGGQEAGSTFKNAFNRFTEASGNIVNRKAA